MTESGKTALIGHTGFVGGNLVQQAHFDDLYNSRNIDEINGKEYAHIVVTAAQARKWWANQNPQEDWNGIERLLDSLARCQARRVTLISTIDVLGSAAGLNEQDEPAADQMSAYGLHRLKLEQAIRSRFDQVLVVRLPGLFGFGLKKNVIFDLLQHNALGNINPRSSFQYYDLSNLWRHIEVAWSQKLELVHLFPAPIATSELINTFFPGTVVGATAAPEAHYDHRTVHGRLFGGDDQYVSDKATVLQQLDRFIETQRRQTS